MKNHVQAQYFFEQAAQQTDDRCSQALAQYRLGEMYRKGYCKVADLAQAERLLRAATKEASDPVVRPDISFLRQVREDALQSLQKMLPPPSYTEIVHQK
jgi:TPR repeat protein